MVKHLKCDVQKFSGKPEDWESFKCDLEAVISSISGGIACLLDGNSETEEEQQTQREIFGFLTNLCETVDLKKLLKSETSHDSPDRGYKAWRVLLNKYEGKDDPNQEEQYLKAVSPMGPDESTSESFWLRMESSAAVLAANGVNLPDEMKVHHFLAGHPEQYEHAIIILKEVHQSQGRKVTWSDCKQFSLTAARRIEKSSTSSLKHSAYLSTPKPTAPPGMHVPSVQPRPAPPQAFNGKCYKCGKRGHRARECREKTTRDSHPTPVDVHLADLSFLQPVAFPAFVTSVDAFLPVSADGIDFADGVPRVVGGCMDGWLWNQADGEYIEPQATEEADDSESLSLSGSIDPHAAEEPVAFVADDDSNASVADMIGDDLYWRVYRLYPDIAGKITGMLLEGAPDAAALVALLDDPVYLRSVVEDAAVVLVSAQSALPCDGLPPSDFAAPAPMPRPANISEGVQPDFDRDLLERRRQRAQRKRDLQRERRKARRAAGGALSQLAEASRRAQAAARAAERAAVAAAALKAAEQAYIDSQVLPLWGEARLRRDAEETHRRAYDLDRRPATWRASARRPDPPGAPRVSPSPRRGRRHEPAPSRPYAFHAAPGKPSWAAQLGCCPDVMSLVYDLRWSDYDASGSEDDGYSSGEANIDDFYMMSVSDEDDADLFICPVAMPAPVSSGGFESYDFPADFSDLFLKDSGASAHCVSDREDFTEYVPLRPPIRIGGICCAAIGRGTVRLLLHEPEHGPRPATLYDVLHVPHLPKRSGHSYRRLFSQRCAQRRGTDFHYTASGNYMVLPGAVGRVPISKLPGSDLYCLHTRILRRCDGNLPRHVAMPGTSSTISRAVLHRRLGHLHSAGIDRLCRERVVGADLAAGDALPFCETCAVVKSHVLPRNRDLSDRPGAVGEKAGGDLWELRHLALGGKRYAFGVVDYFSNFDWVVYLRHKNEAAAGLRLIFRSMRSFQVPTPRLLRVDNDSVFQCASFRAVCDEHGCVLEFAAPYSQWQNGLRERFWRTLGEMTAALLHYAGLGREFWALAMAVAVYIRNRVWSAGVAGIPLQLLTGHAPDLSHLRVFGCPAYVHVDSSRRNKLDPKAFKGVFVGYGSESLTYLVWNPATQRIVSSRNVVFDELWRESVSRSPGGSGGNAARDLAMKISPEATAPTTPVPEEPEPEPEPEPESDPAPEESGGNDRRYPSRQRNPPGEYWMVHPQNPDGEEAQLAAVFAAMLYEPNTVTEALQSKHKEEWQVAIDAEYGSLLKQEVWTVARLPKGRKAIPVKLVFKVKYNADGTVARFKVRLVVKGFHQKHGIDYNETFAPTVKFTSIRVLLALAAQHDWELVQWDVEVAFLNATVHEEIYIVLPPGLEQYDADGTPLVGRLNKSLYGLKQAPKRWADTLTEWLVEFGF